MSLSEMFVTKSYAKGKKMAAKSNDIEKFVQSMTPNLTKRFGTSSSTTRANKLKAGVAQGAANRKRATAKKMGAEGPKRSVAKKTTMIKPLRKASTRAGLRPKTTTGVTMAQVQKMVADSLSRIPGIQDRNSAANRQWRTSANRTLAQAKAQEGAKKAGNSARSQMAVTRSRRVRLAKSPKK